MKSSPKRYVIVGASAAGMAAASAIREVDAEGTVTVFSDEPDAPYFRPLVPYLVSGRKRAEEMTLVGEGPYRGARVDVRLNSRVESIDTAGRTVTCRGGEAVGYDRLLVATGSAPFIPPEIEGTDASGVTTMRTLAHARFAAERVAGARRAVMAGGGMLNLKVAFALLERGLEVTLIVQSPQVLSQLMEPGDAVLIRDALNRAGLKVRTGTAVRRVLANGKGVEAVLLDDGSEMPCELVCIGKGVRPNVAAATTGGLRVDGGVVVDRFTSASAEGVHAAGDVAVTFDPITGDRIVTGLWTNAVEMGRCAGFNMAGRRTEYGGTFGILNATQVADVAFVSMGIVHTEGKDFEIHRGGASNSFRKVVFSPDGTRLVGVLLVGDVSKAGLYRLLIRERMPVSGFKRQIIDHTLHYGHLLLARGG